MSQKSAQRALAELQDVLGEEEKLAYVALIYLGLNRRNTNRLQAGLHKHQLWADSLLKQLFIYLDVQMEVRDLVEEMFLNGVNEKDIALGIIKSANTTSLTRVDIRHTILTHLFLISVADGTYDARARTLLKSIAGFLGIPLDSLITMESMHSMGSCIDKDDILENKQNEVAVNERNSKDGKHRWLYAGLATVAGGTVIGLSAGLAAPFIGAGIASLTGAASAGTFMAGAGGMAVMGTVGVSVGGSMSGIKMMRRTQGISEFEFLGIEDSLEVIAENRSARQKSRENALLTYEGALEIVKENKAKRSIMKDRKTVLLWEGSENDTEEVLTPPLSEDAAIFTAIPEKIVLSRQAHVLITIAGFISYHRDDHTIPFATLIPGLNGDHYSLIWETQSLKDLGETLLILLTNATTFVLKSGLRAAMAPAIAATAIIDNPWGNALTKAEKAGRLLADTLISQVQNNRPVTLLGFSVGARVIYCCLLELAERKAYGLVEEVYLLGSPVFGSVSEWATVVSVVSGRFVNGYCSSDTLLSLLYRANAAVEGKIVAGLYPVENEFIENINLGDTIETHRDYCLKMPIILDILGFKTNGDPFCDQSFERSEVNLMEQARSKTPPSLDVIADYDIGEDAKNMFGLVNLMGQR